MLLIDLRDISSGLYLHKRLSRHKAKLTVRRCEGATVRGCEGRYDGSLSARLRTFSKAAVL